MYQQTNGIKSTTKDKVKSLHYTGSIGPHLRVNPRLNDDAILTIVLKSNSCRDILSLAKLNSRYLGIVKDNFAWIYKEMRKRGVYHTQAPKTVDSYKEFVNACFDSERLNYIDEILATGFGMEDFTDGDKDVKFKTALAGIKSYTEYNKALAKNEEYNRRNKSSPKPFQPPRMYSGMTRCFWTHYIKAKIEYVKNNIPPPVFGIGLYESDILEDPIELREIVFDEVGVPGDVSFKNERGLTVAFLSRNLEWEYDTGDRRGGWSTQNELETSIYGFSSEKRKSIKGTYEIEYLGDKWRNWG
jgi:hypothetical protein